MLEDIIPPTIRPWIVLVAWAFTFIIRILVKKCVTPAIEWKEYTKKEKILLTSCWIVFSLCIAISLFIVAISLL